MDTTGNGATNPLEESVSGIAAPTPVTNSAAASLEVDGLAGRLRAELEQAQVAMEDMNDRIVELARANEDLTDRLQEEMRLREETERQLSRLTSDTPDSKRDDVEKEMLRHELSMAIEELQIMQEELQAAHDELGQRNQGYSSNEASAAVTK